MDRAKLRHELVRDEGYRQVAYRDTLGNWTIGIGHYLGPGTVPRMYEITDREIEALYLADVEDAEDRLHKWFHVGELSRLGDARFRALINMSFNLGNKLGEFKKFIAAVHVSDWATAAVEMMDSRWATQVGKRAERLRDMILKGDDA